MSSNCWPQDWIGNGRCDSHLNKGECNYDGGDCSNGATVLGVSIFTMLIGMGCLAVYCVRERNKTDAERERIGAWKKAEDGRIAAAEGRWCLLYLYQNNITILHCLPF